MLSQSSTTVAIQGTKVICVPVVPPKPLPDELPKRVVPEAWLEPKVLLVLEVPKPGDRARATR